MKINGILLILILTLMFQGCSKDDDLLSPENTDIDTPTTYTFESRYVDGESSVYYTGQVVRNMIISAIKADITESSVTKANLISLYENDNENNEYSGTTLHKSFLRCLICSRH